MKRIFFFLLFLCISNVQAMHMVSLSDVIPARKISKKAWQKIKETCSKKWVTVDRVLLMLLVLNAAYDRMNEYASGPSVVENGGAVCSGDELIQVLTFCNTFCANKAKDLPGRFKNSLCPTLCRRRLCTLEF